MPRTTPHPGHSPIGASSSPTRRARSAVARTALACPTCGEEPATTPEALQQREDTAIVWLEQDRPDSEILERRHCARRQPTGTTTSVCTLECAHCGDGPILTGALAEHAQTHPEQLPEQLRTLLAEQGWQLQPHLLCPDDQPQ